MSDSRPFAARLILHYQLRDGTRGQMAVPLPPGYQRHIGPAMFQGPFIRHARLLVGSIPEHAGR